MLSAILAEELARSFGHAGASGPDGWQNLSDRERAWAPLPSPDGALTVDPEFTVVSKAGEIPWRLFYFSNTPDTEAGFGPGRRASWPLRLYVSRDALDEIVRVCVEREDGQVVDYAPAEG